LQDALGLANEARMNFPSVPEGNWEWRYHPEALTQEVSDRLKILTQLCGRAPQRKSQ
jgi:4-alpha-glucanotransferase